MKIPKVAIVALGLILLSTAGTHPALGALNRHSTWAKTYGGTGTEQVYSVHQTSDSGFIVAGSTNSSGAGGNDAWLVRLDPSGQIIWQKAYGTLGDDFSVGAQQTSDSGFVVSAFTGPSGFAGSAWIFKTDAAGNLQWQNKYGGFGCCVLPTQQTSDDGFIVAGFTDNSGMGDVQVLRLNSTGAVMWARTYGNPTAFDAAFSIQTTPDGGFVVAGITNGYAVNGLIAGDFWVFKIGATGDVVWQHAYGGPGADYAISIAKTSDNGFVVAGWTNSFGAGGNDAWVLRLDNTGRVIWQKAYGGKGDDVAFSVGQTSDGGFIVAGSTNSSGAGGRDAWLFKLTSTGNVVWQKTYGGPGDDNAVSAEETTDGGFVFAATTSSFGNGNSDVWILKLNHNGSISKACQGTGIMRDSNAPVTDTNASATTTTAVANDATVVATATTAITTATSETSQPRCSSSKNQDGQ
ncbi:hypothetical protein E6H19_06845 [Candidatus Bathyarchaeota archaeon]|nr:MAG: hypothetical protein E6H30_08360 [Candidatus Bathyarchaeota archaeon]TMI44769.1 MAG: hypothetical protein E6H19_06845 [Candidatus Bathyarchaeota archaeon]